MLCSVMYTYAPMHTYTYCYIDVSLLLLIHNYTYYWHAAQKYINLSFGNTRKRTRGGILSIIHDVRTRFIG